VSAGHNRVLIERYFEAVIKRVWRCTWRPTSSELGNGLGANNHVRLEMYLENMRNQARVSSWWKWSWKWQIGREV